MTDRLLRALESPHLQVLGHPTGRVLLHRERYTFDFDAVAAEAARARRVAGDQRQPGAAGSARPADRARRRRKGVQVRDLDRRASSEAPGQHAVRRDDGAARLADAPTMSEHAAGWRSSRPAIGGARCNEADFVDGVAEDADFPGDAGPRRGSGRVRDQARHRAARRLGRDDGGGR